MAASTELSYHVLATAIICPASIILAALLAVIVGLESKILQEDIWQRGINNLNPLATTSLKYLLEEEIEAVKLLTSNQTHQLPIEIMQPFTEASDRTTQSLFKLTQEFVKDNKGANYPESLDPTLVIQQTILAQARQHVAARSIEPAVVFAEYYTVATQYIQIVAGLYSASIPRTLQDHEPVWSAAKLYTFFAMHRLLLTTIVWDGHVTSESYEALLQNGYAARQQAYVDSGLSYKDGNVSTTVSRGLRITDDVLNLGKTIEFPAGIQLHPHVGDATPLEILIALNEGIDKMLRLAHERFKEVESPLKRHIIMIVFSGVSIVLCVGICFAMLFNLIQRTLNSQVDVEYDEHLGLLNKSYDKIEKFVRGMQSFDIREIKASSGGLHTHPIEREFYTLATPSRSVLRMLHPALPRWRRTDGIIQSWNPAWEPVPRRLVAVRTSLLFIEIPFAHRQQTAESAKTLPTTFSRLLTTICRVADSLGGILHSVSGSHVILAWNISLTSSDTESFSCSAAVAMSHHRDIEKLDLRFAVVTGDVLLGVVGSESFKTFVIQGPILELGAMMLRLNHVHQCRATVDEATFSTLDSHVFRTRPIEIISLDNSEKTSISELMLGARTRWDASFVAWNEAFDEFRAGRYNSALNLMRRYANAYGGNRSLMHLMSLISEQPPRPFLSLSTETVVDEE